MAEALAAREWAREASLAGLELRLLSAGLGASPGQPASPHATQIVAAHGGDLSEHRSRGVADLSSDEIGLFVAMTRRHRDTLRGMFAERKDDIVTLAEFAGRDGDVADPFGGGAEIYAECYEQIGGLIEAAIPELRERIARAGQPSTAGTGGHNPEKGQSRA